MKARPEVTIEDTFMDNTTMPIFRVRRSDLMVACIHYRPAKAKGTAEKSRITRLQARTIAEAIRLYVLAKAWR